MRTGKHPKGVDYSYNDTWQTRDGVLSEIGMTYKEYLQSDHWKNLKAKVSKRKGYKECKVCGSTKNIHLHHKHYKLLMHAHELNSIISLCCTCHNKVHDIARRNNVSVRKATNELYRMRGLDVY